MSDKLPDEEALFKVACQIASPQVRADYLNQACGDNPVVFARIAALLRVYEQESGFLESPPAGMGVTLDIPALPERPGTQIGPYKLLQQIGEGGMGTVYMAEQTQPVQRKVALKVIKPGMDSRQVIARFEAERQALAMMDHVNIARVLDAGATESGRPYFVMELVHGVPITKYCDDNRLTPRQRLELFVPICQAIQHAHQKGIIHRDIKPSNVMVALYDGKPVPKLIDFGVAKATEQKLTERTLFTQYGTMVGTLEYMSPEQAEMSALGVDTRSDIYSLGVLLYELLTGSTPLSSKRMKEAAYAEILRMIKEEEPPKPSTRLSDSGEALASISANRHTEPAKLSKLMRGELDWIVMKTLEKDRNRRYETAKDFAADVQRYLGDEPVLACPPSVGYRLRKFARRNKTGLALAGLVLFFLVLLGSGAGWAVRDQSARKAEAARQQAERQAKVAGQVESIFADAGWLMKEQKWDEALALAKQAEAVVTGGEADEATAQRVRELLKDLKFLDRLEQIRLAKATIAKGRFNFAGANREYDWAFREYGVVALELAAEPSIDRLRTRTAFAIPLAAALDDWVDASRVDSTADVVGWKRLVTVARRIDPEPLRDRLRATWGQPVSPEVRDELHQLAESIDIRAQQPASLVCLARTLQRVKHSDPALRLLRDAQYVYPGDFWINFELGIALNKQHDHEGAIRFYTAALSIRPNSVAAHNNLGAALYDQKKLDEAIAVFKNAIVLDPKYAAAHCNLGLVLASQKKLDEAIACYEKAIAFDPKLGAAHNNLGTALKDQMKLDEAIASHRKAIELDPKCSEAHYNLGQILRDQNDLLGAFAAYKKAVAADPSNAQAYNSLGYVLSKQGEWNEAIACWRKAMELDPKDPLAQNNLGFGLQKQGQLEEAITCFKKAIELDPKYALAHHNLGYVLSKQGEWNEAIACWRKAIELDPKYALAHHNLAVALAKQGKLEEAITCWRKAIELDPKYALAHHNLAVALVKQGKLEEAITCFRMSIELDPKDVKASDNLTVALNDLAWRLATGSDPNPIDPRHAVELAKEAVHLAPKQAGYWNTLGVANYQARDWQASIAAFEKSMELSEGGNAFDWFFLAMTYWQLDQKDDARKWHEKAMEWMEKNAKDNKELRRFRTEATELLEIKQKEP